MDGSIPKDEPVCSWGTTCSNEVVKFFIPCFLAAAVEEDEECIWEVDWDVVIVRTCGPVTELFSAPLGPPVGVDEEPKKSEKLKNLVKNPLKTSSALVWQAWQVESVLQTPSSSSSSSFIAKEGEEKGPRKIGWQAGRTLHGC